MDIHSVSTKEKSIAKEIWDWFFAILLAFTLAWLIRAFVFEHSRVDGSSMNDTLQNNQHLIVYKVGYFFGEPQRGDIVTIEEEPGRFSRYLPIPDPTEVDYIKRVIGIPGDTVDIKDKRVVINGVPLHESYVKGNTYLESLSFPITIKDGEYLVLGDNRENSRDGRSIGPISKSRIRGKAIFCVWPLNQIGGIYKNFQSEDYKDLK